MRELVISRILANMKIHIRQVTRAVMITVYASSMIIIQVKHPLSNGQINNFDDLSNHGSEVFIFPDACTGDIKPTYCPKL